MKIKQVKKDLYNYAINKSLLEDLLENYKVIPKITSAYSHTPRIVWKVSDKVGNEVCRRMDLEKRIKMIKARVDYIDESFELLENSQKIILKLIADGYKMSQIALKLNCSRSIIVSERDKAIEKIALYAENLDSTCTK